MTIPIQCPQCGRWKPAPDQWAGKLVACDDCGARFKIPAKSAEPEGEPAPEPPKESTPTRRTPADKQPRQTTQPGIPARCDACGKPYRAPSEWAGKRIKCPQCGGTVEVPIPLTDADIADGPPPAG
ncbi:MAG TPA: hypothetical protein VMY37_23755 [Thermoguttaceae bacterium]|nr:hypothetical protein [Thermoguttaceae bacterium]